MDRSAGKIIGEGVLALDRIADEVEGMEPELAKKVKAFSSDIGGVAMVDTLRYGLEASEIVARHFAELCGWPVGEMIDCLRASVEDHEIGECRSGSMTLNGPCWPHRILEKVS